MPPSADCDNVTVGTNRNGYEQSRLGLRNFGFLLADGEACHYVSLLDPIAVISLQFDQRGADLEANFRQHARLDGAEPEYPHRDVALDCRHPDPERPVGIDKRACRNDANECRAERRGSARPVDAHEEDNNVKWLDGTPWSVLLIATLTLGLAPFFPEPHIWEKLKMLTAGTLTKPIDMLDLAFHGTPWLLAMLNAARRTMA